MSEDAFGRVGAGVLEASGSSAQTSSGRLPCRRTGRKCGGNIGLLRVGGGELSSAGADRCMSDEQMSDDRLKCRILAGQGHFQVADRGAIGQINAHRFCSGKVFRAGEQSYIQLHQFPAGSVSYGLSSSSSGMFFAR